MKNFCSLGCTFTVSEVYNFLSWNRSTAIYISIYGAPEDIRKYVRHISKLKNLVIDGEWMFGSPKDYHILTEYGEEYGHLILARKSEFNNDYVDTYVYLPKDKKLTTDQIEGKADDYPQEFIDTFYSSVKENSNVPCLKEWVPTILKRIIRGSGNRLSALTFFPPVPSVVSGDQDQSVYCYLIRISERNLIKTIRNAIKEKTINIDPESESGVSEILENINSLDDYINTFSEELTNKIQSSFDPIYNPKTEPLDSRTKIYDVLMRTRANMKAFTAQKSVINSVARNLKKNRSTIIVGDMGI